MSWLKNTAGTTRQHRGLRSYTWTWGDTIGSALLLLVGWAAIWASHDAVQEVWQSILAWGWPRLGVGPASGVGLSSVSLLGQSWSVVALDISAPQPGRAALWTALLAVIVLCVLSLLLPRQRLPWIYGLRVLAFLAALSLAAYVFLPWLPQVNVAGYFSDLMKIGAILVWLVPLMHAALLYIFPLHLLEKALATALAVLFVVASVPLQVGAMAWILVHTNSLMVLPLYLLGTFLPPLIAQLGIYGYFVSRVRVAERRGPARRRGQLQAVVRSAES
ncbi:MAG TPA: hypothetical protein PKA16_12315 [Ottowia sp.]|uniref:hypothetical protein n=1 Tax=Ottowia sp. TaxID=1898956 RepID=UPI002B8F9C51|nr:hypothetical protein [Ottowia sp.]HMN22162.1 hypothetical protein [Ottowia sp.]